MRHRRAGVHLSRTASHRKALFSNLVSSLIVNERIRTTDAKAKETRRIAERTITWARRLGDILTKKPDRRSPEESARMVHAVRMARRVVRDRTAVVKLFDEIGPRYLGRFGGYTRIVKIGQRPGDAAPMSLLELIPEDGQAAAAPKPAKGAEKTTAKGAEKGAGKTAKGEKADKGAKAEAAPAKATRKKAAASDEGAEKKPARKPRAKKTETP